nr:phospholipase-like protein [Tanacetum cinerariifolium]
EFCLVTRLRFGVENREEYDTQANLPFRRRVFPSHLDGQTITGIDIANAIAGPTLVELYDDDAFGLCCLGILQLVLLGAESRRNVSEWLLRIANDRVAWNKYPWGSYVWPTLYSQLRTQTLDVGGPCMSISLQMKMIRQRIQSLDILGHSRVAAWIEKKGRFLAEMVIPFFEGNIPAVRLITDDNEARSDWWISSKAYFDGFIDQVERVPFDLSRQNMYEIPSDIYRQFVEQKIKLERNKKDVDDIKEEMLKFREEMNARLVRQENTIPIIVGQHYGFSDFSQFQSMQGGLSSFKGHENSSFFNMGTPPNFQTPMRSQPGSSDWQRQMPEQSASQYWPNLQTTIETQHDVDGKVDQNIPNQGKGQQLPSKYLVTSFTVQPPTTMVPMQRVSKTKNKGKKANLSPLNLGGVLEGYNEEENNVTFLVPNLLNFQTLMRSQPGSSDWQRQMPEQSASQYWQPLPQPGSYYSFGQRISKNKNKGKKANLSLVNLGGVLEGHNEEDNNVTFLGSQFTGNILFYENVDPAKVIANLVYK